MKTIAFNEFRTKKTLAEIVNVFSLFSSVSGKFQIIYLNLYKKIDFNLCSFANQLKDIMMRHRDFRPPNRDPRIRYYDENIVRGGILNSTATH